MKPTKMRNKMIYTASYKTRSKQLGSALSKDLQKKYKKRSIRVVEGDSVSVVRGEFTGVDGKVARVSTQKNSVAIEGVKKEKTKGDKFDIYIHTTNLVVTSLNSEDRWRIARLEGKSPKKESEKPKPEKSKESKEAENLENPKVVEEEQSIEPKETKEAEKAKERED